LRSYSLNSRRSFGGFPIESGLTLQLIIINVLVYFLSLIFINIYGNSFLNNFALVPELVLSGKTVWSLVTSMFLHASFFHLFANMFSLFFIGNFLEKIIGRKRFFWVYILSGLLGGIFYIGASFIFGNLSVPAVGASGAIFGLLGVLAVLVPRSKIYLIVGPLILIIVEVLASSFLPTSAVSIISVITNILFLVMIFSLFSFNSSFRKIAVPLELEMWVLPIVAIVPLSIIGFFIDLPIGNSAHIGGLVLGLIYGAYLRYKFPNKTRKLRKVFQ
jgi:membrane associated rhomboid family serine protease